MRQGGWVYILANRAFGTLYIGVTANLPDRLEAHRRSGPETFAGRYRVNRLVHAEWHDDIATAFQRETSLKRWKRQWKIDLITAANPLWEDRSGSL